MHDLDGELTLLKMLYKNVFEIMDNVYYVSNNDISELSIPNNTEGKIINLVNNKKVDVCSFSYTDSKHDFRSNISFLQFLRILRRQLPNQKISKLEMIKKYFIAVISTIKRDAKLLLMRARYYEKYSVISFKVGDYYILYKFYMKKIKVVDFEPMYTFHGNTEIELGDIKNVKNKYDKILEIRDIMPFNNVMYVSICTTDDIFNDTEYGELILMDNNYRNNYLGKKLLSNSVVIPLEDAVKAS